MPDILMFVKQHRSIILLQCESKTATRPSISLNTADIWTSNQLSGEPQSLTDDVLCAEVDKALYRFLARTVQTDCRCSWPSEDTWQKLVTFQNGKRRNTRVYPKVARLSHNEINNNNNKHSLTSHTKDYGSKTH